MRWSPSLALQQSSGVTGRTGSRIAQLLLREGHTVSGLYRRAAQANALLEMGVRGIAGDIATITERYLSEAIAETDALVFTAGAGELDDESMIQCLSNSVQQCLKGRHTSQMMDSPQAGQVRVASDVNFIGWVSLCTSRRHERLRISLGPTN